MSDRQIIDWPAHRLTTRPLRAGLGTGAARPDRVRRLRVPRAAARLPQLDALRENRMPYRGLVLDLASGASAPYQYPWAREAHAPEHAPDGRSTTLCDLLDLPFESQSVDLIVMPHTLEFTSDPHRLLREAERVLMPEGQLVITGFNSLSLRGMRQSFGRMANRPFVPATRDQIAFIRLGLTGQAARLRPRTRPLRLLPAAARHRQVAGPLRLHGSRRRPLVADLRRRPHGDGRQARAACACRPDPDEEARARTGLTPAASPTTHQEHS